MSATPADSNWELHESTSYHVEKLWSSATESYTSGY